MMIKVGNEFLDFNELIEIEKQAKVFEEIDATLGDFSYSFSLPKTTNNLEKLGIYSADQLTKSIYQEVEAEVLDDDGISLYRGYLRVERIGQSIDCSFFSGNYNWISQLTGNVNDLDFSEYDIEVNKTNINASFALTSGLVFPILDIGALITRANNCLTLQDFNGCMYVKTIFKKIFNAAGIKLKGEILTDYIYNNAIICKNNKSADDINSMSCYATITSTQARTLENVNYKMVFANDSTYPAFDGSSDAWSTVNSRYTAPVKMKLRVEVQLQADTVDATYNNRIYLYINGAYTFVDIGLAVGGLYNAPTEGTQEFFNLDRIIDLEAGDTLEVYSEWQQSVGSTQNDVLSGYIKITPVYLFHVYGSSAVPNWTKQDFVSQYINLFNIVADFDPVSKELTLNYFKNIKSKSYTDISEYIRIDEQDYQEFISNYGKNNIFQYEESDDEELREYNVNKYLKYGAGRITVANDFIEEEADIIESDFKAPISYLNNGLEAPLERVSIVDVNTETQTDITSVTDSAGVARFNIANDFFLVGDIVRIEDATNPEYNGDFVVATRAAGYVTLRNVNYLSTSTGKMSKVILEYTDNDDVFLFINISNIFHYNFSDAENINIDGTAYNQVSYPYFNILNVGLPVNNYTQGLSFGSIDSNLFYQRTLLDTYWDGFGDILADPLKLKVTAFFPKQVFLSLTPLSPVYIKHKDTVNLYYINKISGYKGSKYPCEVEFIKLP